MTVKTPRRRVYPRYPGSGDRDLSQKQITVPTREREPLPTTPGGLTNRTKLGISFSRDVNNTDTRGVGETGSRILRVMEQSLMVTDGLYLIRSKLTLSRGSFNVPLYNLLLGDLIFSEFSVKFVSIIHLEKRFLIHTHVYV